AVARDVIRERRRHDKRTPFEIWRGGGISVDVAVVNGGDGSPEIEAVLGIPGTNRRIGHGKIQKREEASIVIDRVPKSGTYLLGDAVPMTRRCLRARPVGPKERNLGFIHRAQ